MMRKLLLSAAIAAMSFAAFFQSCGDAETVNLNEPSLHDFDNSVYLTWNELLLELDRYAPGYRPSPAPRATAYLGLAAYEAVVTAIPENNSLQAYMPGLQVPQPDANAEYHWPTVVNELYAYLLRRFYFHLEVNNAALYQKIEQTRQQNLSLYASETSKEVLDRSIDYAQRVGLAVYDWSATDLVAHNAFLNPRPDTYTPPVGEGLWKPTTPDFGKALFPYWGNARTFALPDQEKLCRPPLPYSRLSGSLYYTQNLEVYNTVNHVKTGNDAFAEEGRWIAIFWSDDIQGLTFSPAMRMVAVLNQLVEKEDLDMAECAELYAKMGLALNDACVSVWFSKYHYNTERPIDYIRDVIAKEYPEAASWNTYLDNPLTGAKGINPSFPAYPSGHSGFAGAGSRILSSFFEYNEEYPGTYVFTDLSHVDRTEFNGTPRTCASFKQLGDEKAFARIPLGVHLRMDCVEGLRVGEHAAQRVLELPWKK
ncbi:MAG: vanadium-dependent haloperoxidase [Saprospiraceae bacterium]|nr:vanadium-dependent haloperoxidase [Saprospiraceae bacterium]